MKKEKRFSRFLVWTLIIFEGVSLALVVGVLYSILSNTMTSKFYNELEVQKAEVCMALQDRINLLKNRLRELSLNNSIRVSLMLGVKNQLLEQMKKQYPYSDGAFFCVREKENPGFVPKLPESLRALRPVLEKLLDEKRSQTISFRDFGNSVFLTLLSISITRKDDQLGTAFVFYDLSQDSRFWKRIGKFPHAGLLIQTGRDLVDLRTGRVKLLSHETTVPDDKGVDDVRMRLMPGQALVHMKGFPGLFYFTSSLPLQQEKRSLILTLSVLCTAIFLMTLFVALLIVRRVSKPLESMADQAFRIASEPSNHFLRQEEIRYIEFGKLAKAFNKVLAELLEAQEELKRSAEKELAASEERYRRVLEAAPDSITLTSLKDGRFLQVNEAFSKLTGFSSEETLGRSVKDLKLFVNPADRGHFVRILKDKGEVNGLEIQYRSKDGKIFDTFFSARLIQFDEEDCLIAVTTNITDLKKTQKERAKLEARLQRAEKMEAIGTLAGGVAHDLNNILGGLVSYPELLLMRIPQDSPLRKPILTIQKSGEKAAAVVQDLLTLARRGVTVTEVVNLNHVISEYMESPEHEKLKLYHIAVEVEIELEPDILNISGSPTHLSKTVMNLISNGAEAIPHGGRVLVSTKNRYIDKPIGGYDDVKEGDYVILAVSDTGMGISPEDRERIFEPFYTKKRMGRSGTGLGLSVVWGTVKDHKGYIYVESVGGKGTTFTLYFPATRDELAEDKGLDSADGHMGKGESILVVDDVEEQREIACGMLKTLGYSVTSVSSGEEALEYMKDNSADLLLLDMIMDPGMDGLDTYRKILEIRPGQRAIIASGYSETERVKEAQRLGAGAYIKKPFLSQKIRVAVKKGLEK